MISREKRQYPSYHLKGIAFVSLSELSLCENRCALPHNKIGDYWCVFPTVMSIFHFAVYSGFCEIADFVAPSVQTRALPSCSRKGLLAPGTNEVRATLAGAGRRRTRRYVPTLCIFYAILLSH
jgi:hypothetical protein